VTGGAGGIGVETTRALAQQGAHVFVATRSKERALPVIEEIKASTKNDKIEFLDVDLSSLKSVRHAAAEFLARKLPLNILINNAGIMASPFSKTVDGFESQFGTNHLGHFLLTTLLIPALKAGAPSRVVNLSSAGHKRAPVDVDDYNFEKTPYEKWTSYARAKSANISFTVELNRRYADQGITSFAVSPGGIMTGLQKEIPKEEQIAMGWMDENGKLHDLFKTVEQGASTSVWAATSPELAGKGGLYVEDCHVSSEQTPEAPFFGYAPHALNAEAAKKLWDLSEKLVA